MIAHAAKQIMRAIETAEKIQESQPTVTERPRLLIEDCNPIGPLPDCATSLPPLAGFMTEACPSALRSTRCNAARSLR